MKRFLIYLTAVLIIAPVQVSAQNTSSTPVEISRDKIRIDGAIYYVHQVKQGQSIVDISKAYDIAISDIEAHNPSAKAGLKPGTFIYIPVGSVSTAASSSAAKTSAAKGSVSGKSESGSSAGPTARTAPREPVNQTAKNSTDKSVNSGSSTGSSRYKYRYRRGDSQSSSSQQTASAAGTADVEAEKTAADATAAKAAGTARAARAAGTARTARAARTAAKSSESAAETAGETDDTVDAEEVEEAAVTASSAVSAAGQKPAEAAPYASSRSAATSEEVRGPEASRETSRMVSAELYDRNHTSHTVTLVLPFGKSAGSGMSDVNHTDFYSGVLLALNDLRESETYRKWRLDVIDLDRCESVRELFSDSNIGESDIIIGPITPDDMSRMAELAGEKRIPVVSPLDVRTSSIADDNPYIFIYPTGPEMIQKRILDRFAEGDEDAVRIVICEHGREEGTLARNVFTTLDESGMGYTRYSYNILQNQKVGEDIKALIPEENVTPARIFIASEDEAFVADALRNLNVLVTTEKRNIHVFGLPKWRNFGSVQLEYLHHLNTHISLGYYLDYSSDATLRMTRKFEEIYHTSPTPYAYQGYDITRFFMESLENYGSAFPVEIQDVRYSAIQSDIDFVRRQDGKGFVNTAVRDITYLPDWSVVLE